MLSKTLEVLLTEGRLGCPLLVKVSIAHKQTLDVLQRQVIGSREVAE